MRSTMRTRAAAAVGAVLLAGLLTACGDDDGGDGYPFAGGGVPGNSDGKNDKGGGGKGGGKVPADLVGKWSTTSISLTQYEDAMTGAAAPTNGTGIILTIESDGSYTEYGLLQNTVYSCSTKLTTRTEGKVSVEGAKTTFKPSKVKTRMTGCGSSDESEKDGTKVTRVATYEFTKDSYSGKRVLKFTDDKGQTSQYQPVD